MLKDSCAMADETGRCTWLNQRISVIRCLICFNITSELHSEIINQQGTIFKGNVLTQSSVKPLPNVHRRYPFFEAERRILIQNPHYSPGDQLLNVLHVDIFGEY